MNALATKLANSKSLFHHFGKVNMKFPWPGHMFLSNDSLFGVFPKYFRGKTVYEPHQLLQLIHISMPSLFKPSHGWIALQSKTMAPI
jgi:hypothetical protein